MYVLDGTNYKPDPARMIGSGGEADVYDLGSGRAVKIFKGPDHPEFAGNRGDQDLARERIAEKAEKLKEFPRSLPPEVVTPGKWLIHRRRKEVVGYEMAYVRGAELLLRYGERSFRDGRIGNREAVRLLLKLHGIIDGIHRGGVVIGDFNDLNVLVEGENIHLIDADSFQFGRFFCRVFTERFIDPLLCETMGGNPGPLALHRPMHPDSDWYAFAVMVLRTLLFVEPYGGVYRPRDPLQGKTGGERVLNRITIFHPEVKYPKPALPIETLSEPLLLALRQIFVDDHRATFPAELLVPDEWVRCSKCGLEHCRMHCPSCAHLSPTAWQRTTTIRGSVECTHVMRTAGTILAAALDRGALRWLAYEDGVISREDGGRFPAGPDDPHSRIRAEIWGSGAVISRSGATVIVGSANRTERISVDQGLHGALIAAAGERLVYASQGFLYRHSPLGAERIGDILASQAMLWTGSSLGFGFYRASGLTVGFLFGYSGGGLDDSIRLPSLRGQILRAQCAFGENRVWFHVVRSDRGRRIHDLLVINRNGEVEGHLGVVEGDPQGSSFDAWLTEIGGICCVGPMLLAATDEGLIRIEMLPLTQGGTGQRGPGTQVKIARTRTFPDTEPFVDGACSIFAGAGGVYVIDGKEIRMLAMR